MDYSEEDLDDSLHGLETLSLLDPCVMEPLGPDRTGQYQTALQFLYATEAGVQLNTCAYAALHLLIRDVTTGSTSVLPEFEDKVIHIRSSLWLCSAWNFLVLAGHGESAEKVYAGGKVIFGDDGWAFAFGLLLRRGMYSDSNWRSSQRLFPTAQTSSGDPAFVGRVTGRSALRAEEDGILRLPGFEEEWPI